MTIILTEDEVKECVFETLKLAGVITNSAKITINNYASDFCKIEISNVTPETKETK